MSDSTCRVSRCAVRRELGGFTLTATVAVLSVQESGFGGRGRQGPSPTADTR